MAMMAAVVPAVLATPKAFATMSAFVSAYRIATAKNVATMVAKVRAVTVNSTKLVMPPVSVLRCVRGTAPAKAVAMMAVVVPAGTVPAQMPVWAVSAFVFPIV